MTTASWNDYYHGNSSAPITKAVVLKAGEGASMYDQYYNDGLKKAEDGGHNAYAYFALHTGSTQQMKDQAKRAFDKIGKRPAMFDDEKWKAESGSAAGMVTLSQLVTAIETYHDEGGIMNVQYYPRSMWGFAGSPNLSPLVELGQHIINADYSSGSNKKGSHADTPYGGLPSIFAVQWKACNNIFFGPWASAKAIWEHPTGKVPTAYVHPAASRNLKLTNPVEKGHDIVVVQILVGVANHTGLYDAATIAKVKLWQKSKGLDDDGEFGPKSWAKAGYKYTG